MPGRLFGLPFRHDGEVREMLGLSRSKHLSLWARWDRMPAVRVMLMLADREEISRGLAEGLEYKEIGLRLGRDSS